MHTSYKQLERYRKNDKTIRVAKYSRCSSDEQKKNGYTIGDQLDLLDEFADEYQLITAGTYVDEGISATLEISKRKALSELIADAKKGKFDIVIFKCIDRFFRNVGEYYECQKQLRKAGVTWISIEESDLDPEDDDAAFKINIYLTMAEYEAKKTSKRIKFNNKMRIKNKQVVCGDQNFHFPWHVVGEKRNRHLAKNPETAPLLMDILDFFETHQSKSATLGYANIRHGLNINMNTFSKLLKDTLLYGEYKGVPNYVEPYITKERFDRIQDILKRNARHSVRSNHVFLFSGLVRCPNCGYKLAGNYYKNSGGYEVISYRCNNFRQTKRCNFNKSTSEKKIEKQILDNLDRYIVNEIARIENIADATPVNDNAAQIAAIQAEMDRTTKAYRKGRMPEDEYDKEYFILEKRLAELQVDEEPHERDLDTLKGFLETDYKGLYEQLDAEHKKAFWRNLIKEFTIDENKKIIPESIIFF